MSKKGKDKAEPAESKVNNAPVEPQSNGLAVPNMKKMPNRSNTIRGKNKEKLEGEEKKTEQKQSTAGVVLM